MSLLGPSAIVFSPQHPRLEGELVMIRRGDIIIIRVTGYGRNADPDEALPDIVDAAMAKIYAL